MYVQWNLSIADILYSGHLSIASTFSRTKLSPAMVKPLHFEPLHSGHLFRETMLSAIERFHWTASLFMLVFSFLFIQSTCSGGAMQTKNISRSNENGRGKYLTSTFYLSKNMKVGAAEAYYLKLWSEWVDIR